MEKFRQVEPDEWVKGDYRPFAQISIKTSDLAKKFGIKFEDYEEMGLGITKVASFITNKGTQFYLQEYPTTEIVCTHIGCLNNPKTAAKDLDEVLEVLELDSTVIDYLYAEGQLTPHELWRQDDNGHKFLIETFPCKADAIKALSEFETLHHKQTYWVEKG